MNTQRFSESQAMAARLHARIATLSDDQLRDAVLLLSVRERQSTAALLAFLAEFDARRLYLAAACSSLFAYCVERLHLSEPAAYHRIAAARAARRYPELLAALLAGRLHLSAACLLAPILTAENAPRLIAEATHRSKREVELLIFRERAAALPATRTASPPARPETKEDPEATLFSSPSIGRIEQVGTIAEARRPGETDDPCAPDRPLMAGPAPESDSTGRPETPLPPHLPAVRRHRRATVRPVDHDAFEFRFVTDGATHQTFQQVRELMRHRLPSGDPARVIASALTLLLEKLERDRFGGHRATAPRGSRRPRQAKRDDRSPRGAHPQPAA